MAYFFKKSAWAQRIPSLCSVIEDQGFSLKLKKTIFVKTRFSLLNRLFGTNPSFSWTLLSLTFVNFYIFVFGYLIFTLVSGMAVKSKKGEAVSYILHYIFISARFTNTFLRTLRTIWRCTHLFRSETLSVNIIGYRFQTALVNAYTPFSPWKFRFVVKWFDIVIHIIIDFVIFFIFEIKWRT